jgi:hypothetical protein
MKTLCRSEALIHEWLRASTRVPSFSTGKRFRFRSALPGALLDLDGLEVPLPRQCTGEARAAASEPAELEGDLPGLAAPSLVGRG